MVRGLCGLLGACAVPVAVGLRFHASPPQVAPQLEMMRGANFVPSIYEFGSNFTSLRDQAADVGCNPGSNGISFWPGVFDYSMYLTKTVLGSMPYMAYFTDHLGLNAVRFQINRATSQSRDALAVVAEIIARLPPPHHAVINFVDTCVRVVPCPTDDCEHGPGRLGCSGCTSEEELGEVLRRIRETLQGEFGSALARTQGGGLVAADGHPPAGPALLFELFNEIQMNPPNETHAYVLSMQRVVSLSGLPWDRVVLPGLGWEYYVEAVVQELRQVSDVLPAAMGFHMYPGWESYANRTMAQRAAVKQSVLDTLGATGESFPVLLTEFGCDLDQSGTGTAADFLGGLFDALQVLNHERVALGLQPRLVGAFVWHAGLEDYVYDSYNANAAMVPGNKPGLRLIQKDVWKELRRRV